MTIQVDTVGGELKVTVLRGPTFDDEKEKVKKLPGKKPIYGIDPASGLSKFNYWEVPRTCIPLISEQFKANELLLSPKVKLWFERYAELLVPLDQLPLITDTLEWPRIAPKYECQENFIRLPKSKNRLICAFSPGVGKTYSSLMRTWVLGYKRILIVIPCSIDRTWSTEIQKFLGLDSIIYKGTPKQRQKLRGEVEKYNIVITTYNMFSELSSVEFDHIIFDEAQCLCNKSTKIYAKAEYFIKSRDTAGVLLLSGTPIQDKPQDLWGLVNLLYPELAGEYKTWESRYRKIVDSFMKKMFITDKKGNPIIDQFTGNPKYYLKEIPLRVENQNIDELHNRIKPYLFRARLTDLVSFEEITELSFVEMTGKQKALYDRIRKEVLIELSDRNLTIPNKLAKLTRLLQVSESPYNLDQSITEESAKETWCHEYIKTFPEDKIIFWGRFKPFSEKLYNQYTKEAVIVNGSLSDNKKALARWSFQGVETAKDEETFYTLAKKSNWPFKPGEARLMFAITDRLSSLGSNYQSCNRQVTTSHQWNGNVDEQASSRVKRASQEADFVYTTKLLNTNGIEKDCYYAVLDKLKVCNQILDGENSISYNIVDALIRKLEEE